MAVAAEINQDPNTYHTLYETDFSWRHERQQSFDPMASVRMFRYDLYHYGHILPETRERVRDEELSLISEGLNRAALTTFTLRRQDDDLTYFKHGQWQSYTGMMLIGLDVAKDEAIKDPRRQFLAEDAARDLQNLYTMRKLKPGEHHVWYSNYRTDVEQRYGAAFMRETGRFPERQMGFLHRAYCNADGDVILESQTVDRSDEDAFTTAMLAASRSGDIGTMRAAYDQVLMMKYGGEFYAGRRNAEINENVWETMLLHGDLIEFFLSKLETIATSSLQAGALEEATKRHMYGVWAAFKRRIDGETVASQYYTVQGRIPLVHLALVDQEVRGAFTQFVAQGKTMVGCGGSIEILKGEANILNADPAEVAKAIFGRPEKSEDANIPKIINCIACRRPSPREKVVRAKSWCCPHCKYEVEICSGKVLHQSQPPRPKSRRAGNYSQGRVKQKPPKR